MHGCVNTYEPALQTISIGSIYASHNLLWCTHTHRETKCNHTHTPLWRTPGADTLFNPRLARFWIW